eukprot:gene18136-19946_t
MRIAHKQNAYILAFARRLHCSRAFASVTSEPGKVDKRLLAKLRKDTGHPFSKCHDALRATNNQLAQAVKWLEEQAEKEGWKKAEKLKGRIATQGLIGAIVDNNLAAMVEVNCETDFVSRNDVFKKLVADIATGALQFKKRIIHQNRMVNSLAVGNVAHLREIIPGHGLEQSSFDGHLIKDLIVSVVNQLGENIVLRRAVTIATSKQNTIGVYAHGQSHGDIDGCHFGKYCALVVLGRDGQKESSGTRGLATSLAQHVVGMQPQCIDKDPEHQDAETALLNQEYMLDNSLNVRTLLNKHDMSVVDFVRYQCGE